MAFLQIGKCPLFIDFFSNNTGSLSCVVYRHYVSHYAIHMLVQPDQSPFQHQYIVCPNFLLCCNISVNVLISFLVVQDADVSLNFGQTVLI